MKERERLVGASMCAAAEPAPEPCVRPELPEDFGGRECG